MTFQRASSGLALLALVAAAALAQPPGDAEKRALEAWQAGYALHLAGRYEAAIERYRASIRQHPSAEAHTFLGWSLATLGKVDEAIAQCKIAVRLDPDFGNPYNDIGVYLMMRGRRDEAIAWLEKAIGAKRYCCYHYAHTNLGRALFEKGRIEEARRHLLRALELEPGYEPARRGLQAINERGLKSS